MARLWQSGWELNSTTDGMEFSVNSGTVSISTTTVRTGTYAGRANPTASSGFWRVDSFGTDQNTGGYQRVAIYIATLPAVTVQVLRFSSAANAHLASIRLTSTGTLTLNNAANTQVGSSSAALSTNTWYVLELKCDATNATGTIDARLNHVSFASGNNSSRGSWSRTLCGAITPNSTCDLFFDDWAVNDSTGSAQTSFPGPGKILHLSPNAAGDSNSWLNTAGGAGSTNNFQLVDDIPPNDATDFVQSGTLNAEDLYNVTNSGLSSSDTVTTVLVGGRYQEDAFYNTLTFRFEIEKASSGTKTQSSDIFPSTIWISNNPSSMPSPYVLVTYLDPDGAAWTSTTLDSMQIGSKITVANTAKIQLSAMWASVDYVPAASFTAHPNPRIIQAINRASTY